MSSRSTSRRLPAYPLAALAVLLALLLTTLGFGLGAAAPVGAFPASAGPAVERSGAAPSVLALLAVQQAQLFAADGTDHDYFGCSVAISGDTAVVGAIYGTYRPDYCQGSAYVFTRSGTTWSQQAQLTAADGAADDWFGCSVAISGDTAVVGTYRDDFGANENQGSAYVFTRSGTTWSQQARLTAADGAADDYFGCSVAISGPEDTAVVGANWDDVGANENQGSAYVFTRSGTAWSQQARLTAADGAAFDYFGMSVAVSGDTAVVGPQGDGVGTNDGQGSAYVFTRSGAVWSQQARLTAADGAAWDQFGYSVALSGDTAVVGAVGDDVGANPDQGSAYVFARSGTVWSQQAKLTGADGVSNDSFGGSVALSGDTVVVGAGGYFAGVNADHGSASVFTRSGDAWSQRARLTAADGAAGDLFGYSVAIAGDTAVVGAYFDDVGANVDQGSAYVFLPAAPPPVGITVTAGPNGAISPGSGSVIYGSSPTYAITPDPGYRIASLMVDGVAQTPQSSWTFVNVTVAHAIAATFAVEVDPSITTLTPTTGRIGSTVTITGTDFGDAKGTVTFAGVPATVTSWTATQAVCSVPAAISGKVEVVLTTAGSLASPPVSFSVRPKIGALSPTRGKVGTTVTITGTGFGAGRGTSKVFFGSKAVTKYVSWSATKIKVKVPRITTGRKAVKIKTAGGTSNVKYFRRV